MILDRRRAAQFCGPPPVTDLIVQVCGIASVTRRIACLIVSTIQHRQDKGTSDNEPCIVLHLPSPLTPASLHPHKHTGIQEIKAYQPTDLPPPTHPTQHAPHSATPAPSLCALSSEPAPNPSILSKPPSLSPHPRLNRTPQRLNRLHQLSPLLQLHPHMINRLLQHNALTPALALETRDELGQAVEAVADGLPAFLLCGGGAGLAC